MGDTEKGNIDLIRRFQTPPFSPNYQLLPNNNNNFTRVGGFPPSHPQMPPISPYSSQSPFNRSSGQQMGLQGFMSGPCHSRSLSQPSVFNSDSLPPLAPSPYKDSVTSPRSGSVSVSVEPPCVATVGSSPVMAIKEGLPPRKFHRRSLSDVPFGYGNGLFQSPPPLPPGVGGLRRTSSGGECAGNEKPAQLVKKERGWDDTKPGGEVMDDLIAAYMNLDSIDVLNSWGANKKSDNESLDEMDSGASNSKMKGGDNSDNDTENSISEGGSSVKGGNSSIERKESLKRSAVADIAPTIRHQRSISMDSFMGKLQLTDDPPNLPTDGALAGHISTIESSKALGLEFGHGEFSGPELKKIMANEKLAELAMADPKRAKRILANRQSAARSKERKMRYISELEHKVQTLQNEATMLSAQLTMLQKDSEGLTSLNNELKFRLQAMEQQAQLRDALNDALTKEIQRLRIESGEISERGSRSTELFGFSSEMVEAPEPSISESNSCHG